MTDKNTVTERVTSL